MSEFLFLTLTTIAGILACIAIGYLRTRDSLNPLLIIGSMLLFQYCFYPLYFEILSPDEIRYYLTDEQLIFSQTLFCAGTLALCIGLVVGMGQRKTFLGNQKLAPVNVNVKNSAARSAWILGIAGTASFYLGAGGRIGDPGTDFGYINEAYHFCIPAAALYLISISNEKLTAKHFIIFIIILSPLLIRGLFFAKRGPLFMFLISSGIIWYTVKQKRPALATIAAAGTLALTLVLIIMLNRGNIRSGISIDWSISPLGIASIGAGNDYIYGSAIANVTTEWPATWGARYLITFFIRPIPRQLWPDKYNDSAEYLQVPFYLNVGEPYFARLVGAELGWTPSHGSAFGIVSDVWMEFKYSCFLILFLLGLSIGAIWRRIKRHVLWFIVYINIMSVTPYMVAQDLMDSGFRILFMSVVSIAVWHVVHKRQPNRTQVRVAT